MEDEDDNTILLIIGENEVHAEGGRNDNDQIPHHESVFIKEEHLDESESEPPAETALEDVECIVKIEEYDIEYLDADISNHYLPEKEPGEKQTEKHKNNFDAEENGNMSEDDEDSSYLKIRNSPTRDSQASWQRNKVSFVNQLREENPEMKKNPKLLVEHLAQLMKNLKLPTPPPNFYTMCLDKDKKIKYQCCFCQAMSSSVISAARHYQDKHGKQYLMCYACGAEYRSTANLYRHEKRCTAADAKIVLQARGWHLGRKGRIKPYLTDSKFENNCSRTVQKTRSRFFCSKCPASFLHRENLIAHENKHDGVHPYMCDACPAAYTSEVALKRHLQSHGDNQFICDHCGKQFKFKRALVSHMDCHRPVRKYGCPHCECRYTQKNTLEHHINLKHLNLPPAYGCPLCPKRYGRMTHVRGHMLTAHKMKMMSRKMLNTAAPHLTDLEAAQNPKLVLKSEMDQNIKNATKKNPENSTPKTKQRRNRSKQENTVQEIYEIALDNTSNKFVQHIKSKVSGDKIKDRTNVEPEVLNPQDNPVRVIRIPSLTLS